MEDRRCQQLLRRLQELEEENRALRRQCEEQNRLKPTSSVDAVCLRVPLEQADHERAKALEEDHRTLETLMAYIPVGIIIANADGTIVMTSASIYRMTQRTREEMATVPLGPHARFWGLYFPDGVTPSSDDDLPLVRAVRDGKVTQNKEQTIQRPDGSLLHILVTAVPIRDTEAHIVGGIVVWIDITERKHVEETLRINEERQRLIIESTELGTFDYNPQTGTLIWNKYARQHFGLPPDAPVDYQTFLHGLHPDDREREHGKAQNALRPESGGQYATEYRTIGLTDGKVRWISARGRVYFNHQHQAERFLGVTTDITEHKQLEDALRREHDLMQQYLDIARVMLLVLDREGKITLINRKGLEIIGYTREEILGKPWFDVIVPGHERIAVRDVFRRLISGEAELPDYHENHLRTKHGEERLLAFNNVVLHDDEGYIIGTLSSGEDITERREAEHSLRESELRYRRLVETADWGVWTVDAQHRTTFINPQGAAMLGYTTEEMLGHPLNQFQFPNDPPMGIPQCGGRRDGQRSAADLRLRRKDDSPLWVHATSTPIHDEAGTYQGVLMIFADISARVKTEQALRENQHLLQTIIDSTDSPIYIKDTAGRFILANNASAVFLGVTKAEAIGKTDEDLLPKEAAKVFRDDDLEVIKTRTSRQFEESVMRADGEHTYISVKFPMFDSSGNVQGVCGISTDITERARSHEERKRLLEEVQLRAAELEATINAIPDGYIVYDADGTILRMNEIARRIIGYTEKEQGLPYSERVTLMRIELPDGRPFPFELLPSHRALHGETVRDSIMAIHHTQRNYWISVSASPIITADGQLLGAVMEFIDITAQHTLQEQQQDLIRTISHDLRAPLTIIYGHVQLLGESLDTHPHTTMERESIRAIGRAVQRMNTMI